ncbi:glycosyl transferase group 2 family protein, partial [Escherichia coli P0299438.2]
MSTSKTPSYTKSVSWHHHRLKRTQRIYGNVFTVSGVIAAFRRSALAEVGYWSDDMITEDIDISWKLQLSQWTIFYEPR